MFRHLVDRLVYYPMPYPEGDWNLQAEAGAQDVWLTTHDGVRLNAWWFPKQGSRFATLFLHGNAGNVTHRIDHAQAINAAAWTVLVVDYRGYGRAKVGPARPVWISTLRRPMTRLLNSGSRRAESLSMASHLEAR
jgi:hypothetical protein